MRVTQRFALAPLAAVLLTGTMAHAADGNRYQFITREDGSILRADCKTGDVDILDPRTGLYRKLADSTASRDGGRRGEVPASRNIAEGVDPRMPNGAIAPNEPQLTSNKFGSMVDTSRPVRKKRLKPEVYDEKGNPIIVEVDDEDRAASKTDVGFYSASISNINLVSIGEKITGMIMLKNNGRERISKLELTMIVPVVGREKPEEIRFLFKANDHKYPAPPQPSVDGTQPVPATHNVDMAMPAGVAKGNAEWRITYLEFE